MTLYLSVGARHIQDWLAATARLRLMRGASLALSCRTSQPAVEQWLSDHNVAAEVARDAGDIAGVVVLQVSKESEVESTATRLTEWLHTTIPGVVWQGWWEEGDSYVEAYSAHERSKHDEPEAHPGPRGEFVSMPPTNEHGLAASCHGCRREPADPRGETDELDPSPALAYGRGCSVRYDLDQILRDRRRWQDEPGLTTGPRRWLDDHDGHPATTAIAMPPDFDALARSGGLGSQSTGAAVVGRKNSRNHLAVVVADGNRLGDFFEAVTRAGAALADFRAIAVRHVDSAVHQAVAAAAAEVTDEDAKVRVIEPHFVGGDDILASVPAMRGWRFVAALIRHFEAQRPLLVTAIETAAAGHDQTEHVAAVVDRARSLSLGVGLVFAHSSHPFADGLAIGERAMRKAKAHTRGIGSAVCFVDLTVDTAATTPHVISSDQLDSDLAQDGTTQSILTLNSSARAQLSELLHRAGGRPDRTVVQKLEAYEDRTGRRLDLDPELDDHEQVSRCRGLLDRARWWPLHEEES